MARTTIDRRWWRESENRAHEAIVAAAKLLEDGSKQRRALHLRHMRMYGGAEYAGLTPSTYSRTAAADRLSRNVIASVIDTACAKLAKNRPAPQFATQGADYSLRRRAKKLDSFGKGVLHSSGAYRVAPAIFRDACVFGTGVAKTLRRGDTVHVERVFPWELLVDDLEALYGEPRQLIQRKIVDRGVLLDAYSGGRGKRADERRSAIVDATQAPRDLLGRDGLADQVEVYEAWHLPSGEGAEDGRHVVCTERGTLLDEDWTRQRFPFAVLRWEEPIAGWWGIGIAERLTGVQIEVNRLLSKIQRSMHLLGIARVYVDGSSGVPKAHITNDIGAVIELNAGSRPPVVVPHQSVHPEVFEHLERLTAQAYEEIGVSQLSASAKKPAGLDAAVALREYNDIESDRLILKGRAFEQWHLDVVELAIDEAREGSIAVSYAEKGERVDLSWTEVELGADQYHLACFPVSSLPQTPAGRLSYVQEMIGAGLIPPDRAMELFDWPDLEQYRSEVTAASDAIRERIARMLDGEEYESPDPRYDLGLAVRLTLATYQREKERGAPESTLDALRQYMDEAQAQLQKAQPQAVAAAPAGPAPAPEQMMPPPMAA